MLFIDGPDQERPGDDVAFSLSPAFSPQAVSPQIYAASSKNHTQILQGMERVGQRELAKTLGVNDSTITRMKDDTHRLGSPIERTAKMLAVMGLKLVPIEAKCFIALED